MNHQETMERIVRYLDEKQGEDIIAYDMTGHNPDMDIVVITSAKNTRHLGALAKDIEEITEKSGYQLRNREGSQDSGWIILDFNDIVVHLFDQEKREFYSLERLMDDARRREIL